MKPRAQPGPAWTCLPTIRRGLAGNGRHGGPADRPGRARPGRRHSESRPGGARGRGAPGSSPPTSPPACSAAAVLSCIPSAPTPPRCRCVTAARTSSCPRSRSATCPTWPPAWPRSGGSGHAVAAASFAADGSAHPAREAVDDALRSFGYRPPDWYHWLKNETEPVVADPDAMAVLATQAFAGVDLSTVTVRTGLSSAADLASWRLGMATVAPFVARLDPERRSALRAAAQRRRGRGRPARR